MKKELIYEMKMSFDEVSGLFGEETLESMSMVDIIGGAIITNGNKAQCNCVQDYCDSATCKEGGGTPSSGSQSGAICPKGDVYAGNILNCVQVCWSTNKP